MKRAIDWQATSIDGLIAWLNEKRQQQPNVPLSQLLGEHEIQPGRLVEMACIDLMHRRRLGKPITVESYLEEFPTLCDPAHCLDLIDAEISIRRELGLEANASEYRERFPELASAVSQLLRLEASAAPLPNADRSSFDSCDFSYSPTTASQRKPNASSVLTEVDCPLAPPDWFVPEKLVESPSLSNEVATRSTRIGMQTWLVRGRHRERGTMLAMKILKPSRTLDDQQWQAVLDDCEKATRVKHPSWVAPQVAATERGHLAVIRPWVFANAWSQWGAKHREADRRRMLATAAFAIASAHETGVVHGGLHPGNLLVDHDGKLHMLDGTSSGRHDDQWISHPDVPGECESVHQRIDLLDFLELIENTLAPPSKNAGAIPKHLLESLLKMETNAAFAELGDILLANS